MNFLVQRTRTKMLIQEQTLAKTSFWGRENKGYITQCLKKKYFDFLLRENKLQVVSTYINLTLLITCLYIMLTYTFLKNLIMLFTISEANVYL